MAEQVEHSIVGVYKTMAQAEAAVHTLDLAGFPIKHISVLTQNPTSDRATHGFITPGDDLTPQGAVMGAWVGGLVSILIGSAFLWIPGFGPLLVLGRLAVLLLAGLEGALAGAATGGLLGALASWGIAEEHMLDYERRLRQGNHLIIAYGTAEEVAQAHGILLGTAVRALHLHAGTHV